MTFGHLYCRRDTSRPTVYMTAGMALVCMGLLGVAACGGDADTARTGLRAVTTPTVEAALDVPPTLTPVVVAPDLGHAIEFTKEPVEYAEWIVNVSAVERTPLGDGNDSVSVTLNVFLPQTVPLSTLFFTANPRITGIADISRSSVNPAALVLALVWGGGQAELHLPASVKSPEFPYRLVGGTGRSFELTGTAPSEIQDLAIVFFEHTRQRKEAARTDPSDLGELPSLEMWQGGFAEVASLEAPAVQCSGSAVTVTATIVNERDPDDLDLSLVDLYLYDDDNLFLSRSNLASEPSLSGENFFQETIAPTATSSGSSSVAVPDGVCDAATSWALVYWNEDRPRGVLGTGEL